MLTLRSFYHNGISYYLDHDPTDDSREVTDIESNVFMRIDSQLNVTKDGTYMGRIFSNTKEWMFSFGGQKIPTGQPLNYYHRKNLENAEIEVFKIIHTK